MSDLFFDAISAIAKINAGRSWIRARDSGLYLPIVDFSNLSASKLEGLEPFDFSASFARSWDGLSRGGASERSCPGEHRT